MYTDYSEEEKNNELYYDDNNNDRKPDKEKIKRIAFFVIIFIVFVILIILVAKGCEKRKNSSSTKDTIIPSLVLGRDNISLQVDDTIKLEVDVFNASIDDPVVSWSSEDSGIASVNDEGYVTALKEGETNIIARYEEKGVVYTKKCYVLVTTKIVKLESIELGQDNITLKLGENLLLNITSTPTDAKINSLVYKSDNENVVSVLENGYITALSPGTAVITATANDTITDTITVVVKENQPTEVQPNGLTLTGLSNGLVVGKTATVYYSLSPSNVTNKTITWTTSDSSVATVDNGVVTGKKAGSCVITATTYNNIKSSLTVVVSDDKIPVSSIKINGETQITMKVGWTRMLYYTIAPNNASNKNVTFTSSNTKVIVVDSNGIMSAAGVGTSTITITAEDGKKTAVANVTVVANTVSAQSSTSGGSSSSGTSSTSTSSSKSSSSTSSSSSSGSSSSSSSSSSSKSSSSSSSSSSKSSSSTSSSSNCNAYDMITITHNEVGNAVVSTYSFDKAKAFTTSIIPTIKVTQLASCLKYAKYSVSYNSAKTGKFKDVASGTISTVGNTILLSKGNGYYKIKVVGTTNNSKNLTKYYYAYVNTSSSVIDKTAPTIRIGVNRNSTKTSATVTITATETGSGLKSLKYCAFTTENYAASCRNFGNSSFKKSGTTYTRTVTLSNRLTKVGIYRLCAEAIDNSNNSFITCANVFEKK